MTASTDRVRLGLDRSLAAIDEWPVPHPAVAVVGPTGVISRHGVVDRPSRIASVSKLLTAYALAIAVEEGAVELTDPVGPPGATLAHVLAHTSGYGFDSDAQVVSPVGTRRIYSNRGIEEAAAHLERATAIPFQEYLCEAVLEPLAMTSTEPQGSVAFGFTSTVSDLTRFAAELLAPRLLDAAVLARWVAVAFPGLPGVIPGVGRFDPCDWGLGFERNFGRPGHWAGAAISPEAFGHFGGSGSFLWVDPTREVAAVCLTGRDFDAWALQVWPPLTDQVIAAFDG